MYKIDSAKFDQTLLQFMERVLAEQDTDPTSILQRSALIPAGSVKTNITNTPSGSALRMSCRSRIGAKRF